MPCYMKCAHSLILLWSLTFSASGTDLTMVTGSTGTAIVLRCIDLIVDSEIFGDDQEMLRRFAYVESLDGTNLNPVNGVGGVWKIGPLIFNNLETETTNATAYYPAIEAHFGISWRTVVYADLDIPLYSALAARLILTTVEDSLPVGTTLPADISIQYRIWEFSFHELSAPIDEPAFTALINQIPNVTLCSAIYRDIIFVVDSSNTITNDEYDQVKTFIINTIDHFNISETRTRVGIIQFALENEVVLQLTEGTSTTNITAAVNAMNTLASTSINTGFAISQAIALFDPELGGRSALSGIARVMIVITHMSSDDNVTGPALDAVSNRIGVIAVGVENTIDDEELWTIASGTNDTHIFEVSDYASLATISESLQESVCEEQVSASGNVAISGTLEPEESQTFKIAIPMEGKNVTISTSQGTVTIYLSSIFRTPSSVANQFRIVVESPYIPVFYTYSPSDNSTFLYCTIYNTATITTHFVFLIGNGTLETTVLDVSPVNEGLTGGEIAGIFFACLIFICGIVLALAYYWFSKRGATADVLIMKENILRADPFTRHESKVENLVNIPEETEPGNFVDEPAVAVPPALLPEAIAEFPAKSPATSQPIVKESSDVEAKSNATSNDDQKSVDRPLIPLANDVVEDVESSPTQSTELESSSSGSGISVEDAVRAQLRLAIEMQNVAAATSAVNEFRRLGLVDVDGDLIRGERVIGLHDCKQGLSYAMAKRDIKSLERAIFDVKQQNYQSDLKIELRKSEILLQDLKKMQNMMNQLSHAIASGNIDLVESITFGIRAISGFDQATVDRMLSVHQCRQDLNTSMANRDLELAVTTLVIVNEKGLEPDLAPEVRQTKKMKKELEYLEKVRQDVLSLSQSRVSEIRSYSNPPAGVQEVMTAVYLVLGYSQTDVKHWTDIQAMMGKTGREGLKRQIMQIDPRKVDTNAVQTAKAVVSPFDVNTVSDISLGLGLFFVFVLTVIDEVEKMNAGLLDAPSPFFFNLSQQNQQQR